MGLFERLSFSVAWFGWLATGSVVSAADQPPAAADAPEMVLQTDHSGCVYSIAFSPDGKDVLTASSYVEPEILLRELDTDRQLRRYEGQAPVVFNPDGRQFVANGPGGAVIRGAILSETITGKRLHVFDAGFWGGPMGEAVFSRDGRRILWVDGLGDAHLYETATGKRLRSIPLGSHKHSLTAAALDTKTGQVFAARIAPSGNSTIILVDATSGKRRWKRRIRGGSIEEAAFSPDGRQLVAGTRPGQLLFWDTATGEEIRRFKWPERIRMPTYCADGRHVLLGSRTGHVRQLDTTTGEVSRTFRHSDWITAMALSRDGRRLMTASNDMTMILWDMATGRRLRTYRQDRIEHAHSLSFNADGRELRARSGDNGAVVWDVTNGRKLCSFRDPTHATQVVRSMAFAADARHVLTSYYAREYAVTRGEAVRWDVGTGKRLEVLAGHAKLLDGLAVSADGRYAATPSDDYMTVLLWDVHADKKLRTLEGRSNTKGIACAAFSHDGRWVLTAWNDGATILCEVATGKRIRTFQVPEESLDVVAFSPDDKLILGTGSDGAYLWDATTGKLSRTLPLFDSGGFWHAGVPVAVAAFANSRLVATQTRLGEITLWEAPTGRRLQTFKGPKRVIRSMCFSPDCRLLATASWDGTVHLWDVNTGRQRARIINLTDPKEWLVVTPDGHYDGSPEGCKRVAWRVGRELLPAEHFQRQYHRPNLVVRALRG